MATAQRKTTSERISSVALQLLECEGAEAVSMRRVAEAVGVTPMAIYHHFPNREALLQAVTDAEFSRLLGFITEARERVGADPVTRLVEMMVGYVEYALARPLVFEYIFSEPRPDARKFPDDFRARRSPTLTPVADAVLAAMHENQLKRDDEWEIALELWALVHGYAIFYLGGRFHLSEGEFRELCRRGTRRLIDGLGA